MNAKTILIKMMGWKSFCMNFAFCFLIGLTPIFAADKDAKTGFNEQKQQYQHERSAKQHSSNFSKKELRKFASVKSKVDKLREKFSQALGEVDKPDKALKLQDQYLQQIVDSIREQGLSVKKYNEISRAVQRHHELKETIAKMIDKKSSN